MGDFGEGGKGAGETRPRGRRGSDEGRCEGQTKKGKEDAYMVRKGDRRKSEYGIERHQKDRIYKA